MNDRKRSGRAPWCAAVILLAGACSASASADFISIGSDSSASTEGLGQFTGSIEYVAMGSGAGTLSITLTNTSDPAGGGFITGLVFNMNSADPDAAATLTSASYPFLGVSAHPAPPFGHAFTAGAALGGDWAGGGAPQDGIGVGDTGTFAWDIFASDALALSAADFMSGQFEYNFVVRFKGFADGGSDKVPARVPGPPAAALLAFGILCGRSRRR